MRGLLLRRAVSAVLLLFAATTLVFFLMHASGVNAARALLGDNATPEQVAARAATLGLDRPVIVQYFEWLGGAARGDLGDSWVSNQTVVNAMLTRTGVTLAIVIGAIVLCLVLGIAIGVLAATRGPAVGGAVQAVAILGMAIPGFWFAIVLVTVFAIQLRWFPATGYVAPTDSVAGWLTSITLPTVALAVAGIASIAMQVRGGMVDVLGRDFVRTLTTRGLSRRRIVLLHALRSVAPPALSVLSLQFVGMLGAAVVIEQIFALPGLGSLTVSSASTGDVPVIMGVVVVTVTLVVIVNLANDLVGAWLNPKVRIS